MKEWMVPFGHAKKKKEKRKEKKRNDTSKKNIKMETTEYKGDVEEEEEAEVDKIRVRL